MPGKPDWYQKTYEVGECERCGKKTHWFPHKNYFWDKQPEQKCLCAECKHPKHDKPCQTHKLTFKDPDVPEAKNLKLRPCKLCEYWIRITP